MERFRPPLHSSSMDACAPAADRPPQGKKLRASTTLLRPVLRTASATRTSSHPPLGALTAGEPGRAMHADPAFGRARRGLCHTRRGDGFCHRCLLLPGSGTRTRTLPVTERARPTAAEEAQPSAGRPQPAAPNPGGLRRPGRRELRGAVSLSALTSALRSHGNGPSRWPGPCGRRRSSSRRDRAPWRRQLGDTRADRYPAVASPQVFTARAVADARRARSPLVGGKANRRCSACDPGSAGPPEGGGWSRGAAGSAPSPARYRGASGRARGGGTG